MEKEVAKGIADLVVGEKGYFIIDDMILAEYSSEQMKEIERIILEEAKARGLVILIEERGARLFGRKLSWAPACLNSNIDGTVATSACYHIGACGCRVIER